MLGALGRTLATALADQFMPDQRELTRSTGILQERAADWAMWPSLG